MAEPGTADLSAQVDELIGATIDSLERAGHDAGDGLVGQLVTTRARLHAPLRVAIAGRVKAGKSTLLNALVGEQLAPTDAGECTRIVTWYQHGPTYRVSLDLVDGTTRPARFSRPSGALDVDLDGLAPEAIRRIVVEWPSPRLTDLSLVDTPGVASLDTSVSDRAVAFLTTDADRPVEVDAVLYLMRHLHAGDLSFLESFHDDLTNASPINAIGLLSRADEIGVGRTNAMAVAARIAGRYRADPRLRRLCQTVLAVNGLTAETAATLTQEEYDGLRQLADLGPGALDRLLLSVDRFQAERPGDGQPPCPVSALTRTHLLQRLGLFGIRVSIPLVRLGQVTSAIELAEVLAERSGIVDLRHELLNRFTERSDVLRARPALRAVARVADAAPVDVGAELHQEIERIRAGAHTFAELRLLDEHHRSPLTFPDDADGEAGTELERLLGLDGTTAAARLGVAPEAVDEHLRSVALATIDRWRRRGEHPLAPPNLAAAAAVLIRTCEGILAGLDPVDVGRPAQRSA
ncbi:MAG: dynamin family protein [Actinomycetota bacterium]